MTNYAQTAYPEQLGNGPDTIASAGCLLVAICDILGNDFGINIDPPTLDAWFKAHADFIGSEDLGWGSITRFASNIVASSINGPGWNIANNSIAEFHYGPNLEYTHFCQIANASAHTIVDAWDGVTKVSPYGAPVASATYVNTNPAPAPVYVPPAPVEHIIHVTAKPSMNVRTSPHIGNNLAMSPLPTGTPVNYVAIVQGDSINGNTNWYQSSQGHFYSQTCAN